MTQVCNLNALRIRPSLICYFSSCLNFHHLASKSNLFAVFEKCPSMDHQRRPRDQSKFRMTNGAEVLV
jgi:hypothetical protein